MSPRRPKTLLTICVEMTVDCLSLDEDRPRGGTLDLDLDESGALLGTSPAPNRFVEWCEGEEVDEEGTDDQRQDSSTAIHECNRLFPGGC